MVGKRFKLKYINEQHISANIYDNGTFIGSISIGEELILELLNDLSEENEQLKKEILWRKYLCGENIEKDKIIKRDYTSMGLYDNKTEKENEQLKKSKKKFVRIG